LVASAALLSSAARSRRGFAIAATEGKSLINGALVKLFTEIDTCPAADPVVRELRKQRWPRPNAGDAPKVRHIIYINLDWDDARRTFMESQLSSLSKAWGSSTSTSLTWERLSAVGSQAMREDKAYASWRQKGFSPTPHPHVIGNWGVAGCAYSHYSAINMIPEDQEELVMIVEDDVSIKPEFPQMWEELWTWMPQDWDVMRVGWFGDRQNCSQVVNSYVDVAAWKQLPRKACSYCGAQAYIVNPKSKDRLLKRFEDSKMTHADELLGAPTPLLEDAAQVPPLKAFAAWPLLAATHFDQGGFPAFRSDRIEGHAGASEETSTSTTTVAPTSTTTAAPTSTTTAAPTSTTSAAPTSTTTVAPTSKEPLAPPVPAEALRREAELAEERARAEEAKLEEVIRRKAENEAAEKAEEQLLAAVAKEKAKLKRESAKEIAAEVQVQVQRKEAELAAASAQKLAVQTREGKLNDEEFAKLEETAAEEKMRQRQREVAKRMQGLKEARKRAEERATQAEKALEEAKAEMAEERAKQAEEAEERATAHAKEAAGNSNSVRKARAARQEAEAKALGAEAKAKEAEAKAKEAAAELAREKKREADYYLLPKMPTVAPLPSYTPPPPLKLPPLPVLATVAPLATLPPLPTHPSLLNALGDDVLSFK